MLCVLVRKHFCYLWHEWRAGVVGGVKGTELVHALLFTRTCLNLLFFIYLFIFFKA